MTQASPKKTVVRPPWHFPFYLQILLAVALGVLVGWLDPALGKALKPLGDGFIKLVKMLIAPIIFCTVVHGIASMGDLKKLGRVGFKALLYFEIVSTLALVIGLGVVNALKPGAGMNIDPATLDSKLTKSYLENSNHGLHGADFLLNIIPKTFFDAFAGGDLLQVLLIAILVAFAISGMGERGKPLLRAVQHASEIFFGIMNIVVKVAPIGVFGAMGFTVGSYGVGALNKLLQLMLGFYLTAGLFVVVVLGAIAWWSGFSIFRFLAYIKEELVLVLGTSSSETALPGLIKKMERLGCAESTVGLVVPTGYSFNLDGTNIYMAMGAIFLAQATNTPLDLGHQISLLLVAMLTSKGASGVTGAGFIALAATLAAVPCVPLESLALLVGIDRFMSGCRSLTNLIGNGVATIVISRWEKEVTPEQLRVRLNEVRP
jgi:aerobic C4-dicarboxylate transport protein